MHSIYSYPVDASCSSHYARDDIKSYIFFCVLSSMETIVVSTGWLVFISILTILHQLEIKIIIIIYKTNLKCCFKWRKIWESKHPWKLILLLKYVVFESQNQDL